MIRHCSQLRILLCCVLFARQQRTSAFVASTDVINGEASSSRSQQSVAGRRRHRPLSRLRSSSYNPNDYETDEEREARMELVRKLQATFYQSTDDYDEKWLLADPSDPTVLCNLPLWRVQWTELPGYQNMLNVHVPHYTHMFRKLVLEHPKPWYFGHVVLPGGSENLGNPDYYLPTKEPDPNDPMPTEEELKRQLERNKKVKLTGTLMQVTDYMEQDDGRLALIVQGVGRIKVLAASQQVPYAVAKVRLLPDRESWEQHVSGIVGTSSGLSGDLSFALIDATRCVAVKEAELLREVDFHKTSFDELVADSGGIRGVSPLSNVNVSAAVNFDCVNEQLNDVFSQRLSDIVEESGDDESLEAQSLQLKDTATFKEILRKEQDVWIQLDEMLRLLSKAQPGVKVPVPAQILGLLPTEVDWPNTFELEDKAEQLEERQVRVGTFSRSPFVRLSKVHPDYPDLRRASRLSYAIWMLLEAVAFGNQPTSKQTLLEKESIGERLDMVNLLLKQVNGAIREIMKD